MPVSPFANQCHPGIIMTAREPKISSAHIRRSSVRLAELAKVIHDAPGRHPRCWDSADAIALLRTELVPGAQLFQSRRHGRAVWQGVSLFPPASDQFN
jgi:hypothetical protein